MRTIYIYLSVAGWIWFVIAGSYLIWRLWPRWFPDNRRGFAVKLLAKQDDSTEAKQPNEQ